MDDLVKRLREYRIGCGVHCSHYENREPLTECIEAASRIEQLERLLEQRDSFIVKNDLWHDFVATLGEKKDG